MRCADIRRSLKSQKKIYIYKKKRKLLQNAKQNIIELFLITYRRRNVQRRRTHRLQRDTRSRRRACDRLDRARCDRRTTATRNTHKEEEEEETSMKKDETTRIKIVVVWYDTKQNVNNVLTFYIDCHVDVCMSVCAWNVSKFSSNRLFVCQRRWRACVSRRAYCVATSTRRAACCSLQCRRRRSIREQGDDDDDDLWYDDVIDSSTSCDFVVMSTFIFFSRVDMDLINTGRSAAQRTHLVTR